MAVAVVLRDHTERLDDELAPEIKTGARRPQRRCSAVALCSKPFGYKRPTVARLLRARLSRKSFFSRPTHNPLRLFVENKFVFELSLGRSVSMAGERALYY